jgi:hypothetical protein
MIFSAVEVFALMHDLKQQRRQFRRVDRSGMRTNDHANFAGGNELDSERNKQYCKKTGENRDFRFVS